MKLQTRLSILFFIGIFAAGSTALVYYYYFVYSPPLKAAEAFMAAMENGDLLALRRVTIMTTNVDEGEFREPTEEETQRLLTEHFERGRILDQRKREGKSRDYYYLVYREPDGGVHALLLTRIGEGFRVVIPERRTTTRESYLWEYTWTN